MLYNKNDIITLTGTEANLISSELHDKSKVIIEQDIKILQLERKLNSKCNKELQMGQVWDCNKENLWLKPVRNSGIKLKEVKWKN